MAKLHGLTMGLDVCATFHMGIAPTVLHDLTETIVAQAVPAYLMAVAGNADPMLGYLTTSFREHPRLRHANGRQITTAMRNRLLALGVMDEVGVLNPSLETTAALYGTYRRAAGDTRATKIVHQEAVKKIADLRQAGYDLGYGDGPDLEAPPEVKTRLQRIYTHARHALYATVAEVVINDASQRHLAICTLAGDRDDYIAHPHTGERIREKDISRVVGLYPSYRPQVQIVLSDGLNANAINENLRAILPPLRYVLAEQGCKLGDVDLVVTNGRVRAGYHIGALLGVEVVIHLIGERPGTGLDTLSAYLTYGRDSCGRPRWSPDLDHSCTTAVCGIHRQGKRPAVAAEEISQHVKRMLEERCSGVALGAQQGRIGKPP